MMLVVDANILFSALIASNGKTRSIFSLFHLELISPEFIERELDKHFSEIVRKSKCSEEEVRTALQILLSRIKILPEKEYEPFVVKTKEFSPDPQDAEYFAVALAFGCPLWSNDKRLKEQGVVKVLSTPEVSKVGRGTASQRPVACSLRSPPADLLSMLKNIPLAISVLWTSSTSQVDRWYIFDMLKLLE